MHNLSLRYAETNGLKYIIIRTPGPHGAPYSAVNATIFVASLGLSDWPLLAKPLKRNT